MGFQVRILARQPALPALPVQLRPGTPSMDSVGAMVRRILLAAALAVCLHACGAVGLGPTPTPMPSLTESQVTWCRHHDMTPLISIGAIRDFQGNEVLDAAHNLGIPIPQVIHDADAYFGISNVSAGIGK